MRKNHPILSGLDSVKPYKLVASEALYSMTPPPMQIDQFLTAGCVMGITAYPGVGKTWLAMEIARAVATGKPFLGRYRTLRGGVLFLASDSSDFDYAQQWTRLAAHTGDDYEAIRFLIQSPFMFEDRDEIRKLIATHRSFEWGEPDEKGERERGFSLIIFDTLSRLTRANQNDNTEMEEVFRNIRLLAEATGAALVILHHNSKKSEFNDGSDWRGAMSQIGALDSWVQLSPSLTTHHLIGCQFKKFRGITPPDFAYQMNVDDKKEASIVASDEPVTRGQKQTKDASAQAIMAYVKENPGKRACEIRDALYEQFKDEFTQSKFRMAVNNRIASLRLANHIEQYLRPDGKAVYRAIEKPDPAGADVQP